MTVFCIHIDLNNLFHFQFVNDLLEKYSYEVELHIIHEERNMMISLIYKHFGYLEGECIFFHYVKTPYLNGDEIENIYSNYDFDSTFYLRSTIGQYIHTRDWIDVNITSLFSLCRIIKYTQKERNLVTLSQNNEPESSKMFRMNICKELDIVNTHVYNGCEVIFNGENISDIIDTICLHQTYSQNSISKVIDIFKIRDKPYVTDIGIRYSTMHKLSHFIIDCYETNESNNVYFDFDKVYSLTNDILPTILHCIREKSFNHKQIDFYNRNDKKSRILPSDHWISKYMEDYIDIRFNKI